MLLNKYWYETDSNLNVIKVQCYYIRYHIIDSAKCRITSRVLGITNSNFSTKLGKGHYDTLSKVLFRVLLVISIWIHIERSVVPFGHRSRKSVEYLFVIFIIQHKNCEKFERTIVKLTSPISITLPIAMYWADLHFNLPLVCAAVQSWKMQANNLPSQKQWPFLGSIVHVVEVTAHKSNNCLVFYCYSAQQLQHG